MPILVTSIGLSTPKARKEFSQHLKSIHQKKALIVTTAARGKSKNKYSKLAKEQLISHGVGPAVFFDLERERKIKLSDIGVVYVCGGNTFKLLKAVKNSNFKLELSKFLARGGIYIGVSAGSIILGPSIEIASFGTNKDKNEVGLKDLSGLNFLPFSVSPHFKKKNKVLLKKFSQRLGLVIKPLADEEIINIENL